MNDRNGSSGPSAEREDSRTARPRRPHEDGPLLHEPEPPVDHRPRPKGGDSRVDDRRPDKHGPDKRRSDKPDRPQADKRHPDKPRRDRGEAPTHRDSDRGASARGERAPEDRRRDDRDQNDRNRDERPRAIEARARDGRDADPPRKRRSAEGASVEVRPLEVPPKKRVPREPRGEAPMPPRSLEGEPDNRFLVGPRPRVVPRQFPVEHLDEDALKVIRRLTRAGHLGYLVGGSVRDLLLGRKPKDFDVATSARPHEVRDLFRNCRIIGRRFRLAHILFGSRKVIETATFRRDPGAEAEGSEGDEHEGAFDEAAGDNGGEFTPLTPRKKSRDEAADLLIRHDNVFGDPHEDALRRDFTINGLFYDIERGEVIDYVGGLRDVENRVVSTIGLPDVRFREDPVRILRAIKFAARCDLGIDPEVYDAMVAQTGELTKAARPRLFEEILRLLRGGAAHRSFWLAWEVGVLGVVLPELASFLDDDADGARWVWGRLRAVDALIAGGEPVSDAVLLTALLMGVIDDALDGADHPPSAYEDLMHSIGERLAVPRRMKDRVRLLVGCQARLRSGRVGSLSRREFFGEAFEVHKIDCAARDVAVQVSMDTTRSGNTEEQPLPEPNDGPRRRRRRRR